MISALKFHDLDAELEAERAEAERLSHARYTEDEVRALLKKAHQQGYEDGYQDGAAAGRQEMEQTILARHAETLDTLGRQIAALDRDAASHRVALEAQLIEFILSIAEKVFPEFIETMSRKRAAEHVRASIRYALGSAVIRVHLAPGAAEALRPRIEALAAAKGCAERLEILAEAGMRDGDARVDWDNGFLEYSFADICDQILTRLRRQCRAQDTGTSRST